MPKKKSDSEREGLLIGSLKELREKLEERLDELIEKGEKRAKSLKDKTTGGKGKGRTVVDLDEAKEKVQDVYRLLGLVSRKELEEIQERLDDLEVLLEQKGAPKRKRRRPRKKNQVSS